MERPLSGWVGQQYLFVECEKDAGSALQGLQGS